MKKKEERRKPKEKPFVLYPACLRSMKLGTVPGEEGLITSQYKISY
jgi:hypothetical protein